MTPPTHERNYLSGYHTAAGLTGLTGLALLIHGYHFGIEDQAIYIPAILRDLNPRLFPRDATFFESQTHAMLLDKLVAPIVQLSHAPVPWVLFVLHLLTIFLLLFACSRIVIKLFGNTPSAWGGLALLTCVLTLPVAGTAQYIADQYLHPRALATALILVPIADLLPGTDRRKSRYLVAWCVLWMVLAAAFHFQMALFGVGLYAFLLPFSFAAETEKSKLALAFAGIPIIGKLFEPGSDAWQEAARTRGQHYLLRWSWYELLGIIAPILLLFWFSSLFRRIDNPKAAWLSQRLAWFALISLVVGGALVIPPGLERLTPYQPMRVFILIYAFLALLGGGLLGHFFLKKRYWRWAALFVPLAAVMCIAQLALFPDSPHIEWPGRSINRPWEQAFLWARVNTPRDAYFALSPHYLSQRGEDFHGFRAWAWRSQMSDLDKDPGVVSLIPDLAPEWQREVHALEGWNTFNAGDFTRLKREFGVSWAVLEKRLPDGLPRQVPDNLECPYQNSELYVCKIR
ncbi:MAG TPA: hypothetical protein VF135_03830 [Terriglobales bacterium]